MFGLIDLIDPLVTAVSLALYGLLWGAVAGALLGLLVHAVSGGRRDFASAGGHVWGSQYDVMVDDEVADEAARILRGHSR